jgi:hypothetical protein
VVAESVHTEIVKKVSDIYEWLDSQVLEAGRLGGRCDACGRCCDFAMFGHRLFVSSPEMLHFTASHAGDLRAIIDGICPYNVDGKCLTYSTRFAGCRIFCCGGDADLQSMLTEAALEKFKGLCLEYEMPYRYTDLASALNCAGSDTCR